MLSNVFALLLAVGSVAADGLNARAVAAGKTYFGSATDNGELSDTTYSNLLKNTQDFGQITPGNSMKWDATEPSQNSFSFSSGDVIANLAATNGQKLRCHTLVWHSQLPSWVSNGNFDNATLISVMKNHITTVMTHYKGKCLHWDVVNEALNDDGTYRSSVFYNTIGPAFIPIAFAAAAAADPSAKLYYNDYSIETAGAKSTGAQNIVKSIKAYGARIDGVGMQSHIIVGSSPSVSQWTENMNAFTSLGVEVALTELDIRTSTPETSAAQTQQATDYANAVSGCLAVSKCVGITIWDFTDKYSWIPSVFSGQGAALPWDSNMNKKENVYNAILNAWGSAASNSSGGASAAATTPSPVAAAVSTPSPTSTTAATNGTGAGTVAKYGQCGGKGWTGATSCMSGSTCNALNDWYSQCQ